MGVYFLTSRTLLLLALILLITAVFWGWANNTTPEIYPEHTQLEKYASRRPGATTKALFIVSIFLGTGVISFSIWLEFVRSRQARKDEEHLPEEPQLPGTAAPPDVWR